MVACIGLRTHNQMPVVVLHSPFSVSPFLSSQRVSRAGIDFVLKRSSPTAGSVASGRPVAILHQQGRFLPGESAEQWRGEGRCDEIKLGEVLDLVPHQVVTSIVASSRIAAEEEKSSATAAKEGVSAGRLAMLSKSHMTDIMQKTRRELESSDISMDELERCIAAYRFEPERLELRFGGPDSVMWDRWEWFLCQLRTQHDNLCLAQFGILPPMSIDLQRTKCCCRQVGSLDGGVAL